MAAAIAVIVIILVLGIILLGVFIWKKRQTPNVPTWVALSFPVSQARAEATALGLLLQWFHEKHKSMFVLITSIHFNHNNKRLFKCGITVHRPTGSRWLCMRMILGRIKVHISQCHRYHSEIYCTSKHGAFTNNTWHFRLGCQNLKDLHLHHRQQGSNLYPQPTAT